MQNIPNKATYLQAQQELEHLLAKPDDDLTSAEAERVRELWMSIKLYEQAKHIAPLPSNLPDMVKLRMFEMNIKPAELVRLTGLGKTKLSLVLSGKQKPDIAFLKAIYSHLNIDADFILKHV